MAIFKKFQLNRPAWGPGSLASGIEAMFQNMKTGGYPQAGRQNSAKSSEEDKQSSSAPDRYWLPFKKFTPEHVTTLPVMVHPKVKRRDCKNSA